MVGLLLSLLNYSNTVSIAGRAFGVVPREEVSSGYMDLLHDDYQPGDFLKEWQEIVLDTAQAIVDLA
jgi:hypothetical protein